MVLGLGGITYKHELKDMGFVVEIFALNLILKKLPRY